MLGDGIWYVVAFKVGNIKHVPNYSAPYTAQREGEKVDPLATGNLFKQNVAFRYPKQKTSAKD